MLYNTLEFVYKKGIEAFDLLFNLLTLTTFNKKFLRGPGEQVKDNDEL